jgi:hypothetical protein
MFKKIERPEDSNLKYENENIYNLINTIKKDEQ